ncbi:MAG: hypothetical protein JSV16_04055, partial [Candidatus Hydrogenedentota bacterium]
EGRASSLFKGWQMGKLWISMICGLIAIYVMWITLWKRGCRRKTAQDGEKVQKAAQIDFMTTKLLLISLHRFYMMLLFSTQ